MYAAAAADRLHIQVPPTAAGKIYNHIPGCWCINKCAGAFFARERACCWHGRMDGWLERASSSFSGARSTLFFVCWEKLGENFFTDFHWARAAAIHMLPLATVGACVALRCQPFGSTRPLRNKISRSLARSPPQPTTPKPRAQSSTHF